MSELETWYCVNGYSGRSLIDAVQVERSTEKSVWVLDQHGRRTKSSRYARRSSYDNYFPTWDEAHQFLTEEAEKKRDQARRRLDKTISFQDVVRNLRKEDARELWK